MNKLSTKSQKTNYTSKILHKMAAILRFEGENEKLADACIKVAQALAVQAGKYEKQEIEETQHPFSDELEELFGKPE